MKIDSNRKPVIFFFEFFWLIKFISLFETSRKKCFKICFNYYKNWATLYLFVFLHSSLYLFCGFTKGRKAFKSKTRLKKKIYIVINILLNEKCLNIIFADEWFPWFNIWRLLISINLFQNMYGWQCQMKTFCITSFRQSCRLWLEISRKEKSGCLEKKIHFDFLSLKIEFPKYVFLYFRDFSVMF